MAEHPATKLARMWDGYCQDAKDELDSRWPILAATLTQLVESQATRTEHWVYDDEGFLRGKFTDVNDATWFYRAGWLGVHAVEVPAFPAEETLTELQAWLREIEQEVTGALLFHSQRTQTPTSHLARLDERLLSCRRTLHWLETKRSGTS